MQGTVTSRGSSEAPRMRSLGEQATHLPLWALLVAGLGVPGRPLQPCADLEAHALDGGACVEAALQQQHEQQQQQQQVIGL